MWNRYSICVGVSLICCWLMVYVSNPLSAKPKDESPKVDESADATPRMR